MVISSTLVAPWTVWWAWRMWSVSGLSWHFPGDSAGLFLHGSGFNLYADAPWLQTGPLSLVVAALLRPLPANIARNVALVAMTAAGPLADNPLRVSKDLTVRPAGYRSARRGDYRVVIKIVEVDQVVLVDRIDHRADVYRDG